METLARRNRIREYPTFAASIICGSLRVDGLVRNLTAGGAMFECEHHLKVGAKVRLEIEGLGTIASSVAWSLGNRTGLRFDEPRLGL